VNLRARPAYTHLKKSNKERLNLPCSTRRRSRTNYHSQCDLGVKSNTGGLCLHALGHFYEKAFNSLILKKASHWQRNKAGGHFHKVAKGPELSKRVVGIERT